MLGFPEIGLSAKTIDSSLDQKMAPFPAEWGLLDEPVVHVFTHFALEAHIYRAQRRAARCQQWKRPVAKTKSCLICQVSCEKFGCQRGPRIRGNKADDKLAPLTGVQVVFGTNLMIKMAHPGERHRNTGSISGGDNVIILE